VIFLKDKTSNDDIIPLEPSNGGFEDERDFEDFNSLNRHDDALKIKDKTR